MTLENNQLALGSAAKAHDRIERTLNQLERTVTQECQNPCSANLLSFVVPVKDEEESLRQLSQKISSSIPAGYDFEVIFIDDGSCDSSWPIIEALCEQQPAHFRGIRFRHNAGKAASLQAGFEAARGEIVFTMDADLQDDPQEIARFLAKLDEGYDLVSGWKRVRHDPWHKVFSSRIYNRFASLLGRVQLQDQNCGFKCYRAEVLRKLRLHGELHRVIPSLAKMHGFRSAEIEVVHHPRRTGRSKYGWERIFRGVCDITTVGILSRFRHRPSHFFNAIAAIQLAIGMATMMFGFGFSEHRTTALLVSLILIAIATSSFLAGHLAELIIRGPLAVTEPLPINTRTSSDEEKAMDTAWSDASSQAQPTPEKSVI